MTDHRDAVGVGASAGGVEALRALVAGLPADYPGAIFVVLHVPRYAPTALPPILSRSGPLPAEPAVDGEPVKPGRIYVAPSDHHLLVLDGHVRLTRGPAENGHRPAIDPLFRSLARTFGRRAVGVVLSGTRDDGAAGLAGIVRRGGTALVQDPADALYRWMPEAALTHVPDAQVATAADLGSLIARITAVDLPDVSPADVDPDALLDAEVAMSNMSSLTTDELNLPAAGYGCPSCGGSLFELDAGPMPRYRCRVGHAWSPESLLGEQAIAIEGALWMALRALEEKSALGRRMAQRGSAVRMTSNVRFRDMAADAEAAGGIIRDLIAKIGSMTPDQAWPDRSVDVR